MSLADYGELLRRIDKSLAGQGTLSTLNSGTLQTLGTLRVMQQGTVSVTQGTLNTVNALGSATVFGKHDLKVYDNIGTFVTAVGTLITGVANKIIKVHQYSLHSDGTVAYTFNDNTPVGGSLLVGAVIASARVDGYASPFIPYPGYHFKTATAGSALCLGTLAQGISGTAYIHMVYTDDDAS